VTDDDTVTDDSTLAAGDTVADGDTVTDHGTLVDDEPVAVGGTVTDVETVAADGSVFGETVIVPVTEPEVVTELTTPTPQAPDPSPEPVFAAPELEPELAVAAVATDWQELQGKFVDDPAAAVQEAGGKVEQALAELRAKVETGSTEDLRTAFRRYRDLFASLR
jgi:hypothetical protein